MEDTKPVKKITDWNPIEIRIKRQSNNSWKEEVINDLKELKLRNWIKLVKDRYIWKNLVQKTKIRVRL
jgi:translation initiation factor IF-3